MSRGGEGIAFALGALLSLLIGIAWLGFCVWAIYSVVTWLVTQ